MGNHVEQRHPVAFGCPVTDTGRIVHHLGDDLSNRLVGLGGVRFDDRKRLVFDVERGSHGVKDNRTAWVDELRNADADIVAIDGKTSRRSHDRSKGRNPLHLVSAWASRQRLVLGRQAYGEKSNEITAIPALLERLELSGALVTTDAMGCQTKIAGAIRDKGADYLLALKDNWPALRTEVERFFADPEADSCERCDSFESNHGRIETRRHAVCHQIDWLKSDRRFPGEWRFRDLAMIAMVEAEVQREGKLSIERRYFLILRKALGQALRHSRTRPLARRKPAALGYGCRLP